MTFEQVLSIFGTSWMSLHNLAERPERPLLAHYTSLSVVEKIISSNELWFSNPLFMNDDQEMRFGLLEGHNALELVLGDEEFRSAAGGHRVDQLRASFKTYFDNYEEQHAINVYVFCLSEHDPADRDGTLSMWRGYGQNGSGAALVFRTDFISFDEDSPLLVVKVRYATGVERKQWLSNVVETAKGALLSDTVPDEAIPFFADVMFQLMLLYSLSCKHQGFKEENEWRVIYLPDRDRSNLLNDKFHYVIGKRGVEPKLRFPINPLPIKPPDSWNLDGILERIVLGPQLSSVLAIKAVGQMLDSLGKPEFKNRVVASEIPFRPTN